MRLASPNSIAPSPVSSYATGAAGAGMRLTVPAGRNPAVDGPETLFPAVPTLFATRLQLELLLSDRSVDLRAAAGIILNDLGATLEIFRRAGEEAGAGQEPFSRLEDCLASLGTDVWIEAVCANAVERVAVDSAQLAEITAFWEHRRLLAYACWLVAERTEGVCPEEAYLVGLLHEAAMLPALLGWALPQETWGGGDQYRQGGWSDAPAALLAAHWQLPEYLHSLIAAPHLSPAAAPSQLQSAPSRWRALLTTAYAWSRGEDCLLSHTA